MPKRKDIPVVDLTLDLRNYRTTRQPSEISSIRTIISINQNRFWGVMESLLEEGFSPVENILVLEESPGKLIIREGNRRIGSLKLMLGILDIKELIVPENIITAIAALSSEWKKENSVVPCVIYGLKESGYVSKIVARVHGRAEKSSRLPWTSVAKARQDRDESRLDRPNLDLLEKYLTSGTNFNARQREEWSGDYHLTVLDAFLQKHIQRLGVKNNRELADSYPKETTLRVPIENILYAIGTGSYGFEELRYSSRDVLLEDFQIPALTAIDTASTENKVGGNNTGTTTATPTTTGDKPPITTKALPLENPKSVIKALKGLSVRGAARDKVATLVSEACLLNLERTPLAFCFLLRSMFEISAAAYIADNKGSNAVDIIDKKTGKPKSLGKILVAIKNHYIDKQLDKDSKEAAKKLLHGPGSVLGNSTSILSITSLNNLVHSPDFSGKPAEISVDFHKMFPLLKMMNA